MSNKLFYLYCVTNMGSQIDLDASGIGESSINCFEVGNLKVWFSEVDEVNIECSMENLKIHNRISLKLMESFTVIPFKFGTVVKSKDEVYLLMDKICLKINEKIDKLSGMYEYGIKVFGEIRNEAVIDFNKAKTVKRLSEIKTRTDSMNYLMEKVRLYEKEKIREQEADRLKNALFTELILLSDEYRILNGNKNKLLFNGAFLIKKGNVSKFMEQFDSIKDGNPEFSFLFSGPWPPYNFVDISV